MLSRGFKDLTAVLALLVATSAADSKSPDASLPRMTPQTRIMVIRSLNAEHVFIKRLFPMGEKGLTLKNGVVSPSDAEIRQRGADFGPAAKPGDRVQITNVEIKDKFIHFEINGGPKKKKKWYEHVQVSGMGGTYTPNANDPNANPRGSCVDLAFDKYVPELSPDQVRDLLAPVLDFHAKSAAEAYLETVPPKVRDAIKDHRVLVGMNREMVGYSKGRPPKKVRERDKGVEYEEWIYGEPPQDVEFVRFVGDEVVRLELMKVNGEKVVRTEKEVELAPPSAVAEAQPGQAPGSVQGGEKSASKRPKAPTLRRPGEEAPKVEPAAGPSPLPPAADPDASPVPSEPRQVPR
jgi:hypothetical protein